MKRLFVAIGILALAYSSYADRYVARHEDIKSFLKTTTYVVLDDNPMSDYNMKIKPAIENSWKITPYEFISSTQFEEMRSDINKSFLVKLQVKFSADKLEATYNFLCVVLGAAVKRHTDLPDICSVPLGYASVPEDSYTYKLESLIRFAQNHIRMLDENPQLIKSNIFDYYNKNRKETKTKELWLLEQDIEPNIRSQSEVRKLYPHPFKIVTKDDLEKAIAEKNENIVYLHKVGPEGTRLQARCYKILIGAGDDQFYYFNYHMINRNKKRGDGFLPKDFKKIK
ncbi:MAG: hypothetical protein WBI34_10020 [Tenuifilaceae bacterium]|jgi:hypothetical protein|nr:hypothetical protein [Bacteroidales bacterium]MDI9515449.1 hypothetical protein [Bacteroidota bacterium]NLH56443.1 hypothetical protein [Rikenellaceae bacterium]OQC63680.1 MAG: hypothetical protein BWX49_01175 [Bacteroidetes bacterium ADurb.Bin008]HNV81194.1 hypothetical protein [Tenuifilaceae bacterium]